MGVRELKTGYVNVGDENFAIYLDMDDTSKARLWARSMLHKPLMDGLISQEQVDLIFEKINEFGGVTDEQYNPLVASMPGYRLLGRDTSVELGEDPLGHALSAVQFAVTVLPSLVLSLIHI